MIKEYIVLSILKIAPDSVLVKALCISFSLAHNDIAWLIFKLDNSANCCARCNSFTVVNIKSSGPSQIIYFFMLLNSIYKPKSELNGQTNIQAEKITHYVEQG